MYRKTITSGVATLFLLLTAMTTACAPASRPDTDLNRIYDIDHSRVDYSDPYPYRDMPGQNSVE